MRSKLFTTGLVLALGAGCAFNALAQVKVPYDAAMVARNAGYLDVLIRLAWDGFDPSTQSV